MTNDFAIRQRLHASIIDLPERFDFKCRKVFFQCIEKVTRDPKKHLILNLEQVTFLDRVAIGLMIKAHRLFADLGRRVFLIRPQGLVKQMLEQRNLPAVIPVRDCEDQACFESAIVTPRNTASSNPIHHLIDRPGVTHG